MALFNYNDLLNETILSNKSVGLNLSYDYLNKYGLFKSETLVNINTDDEFDIFLSHSFNDREIIPSLKRQLESLGYSVYVDWINDRLTSRKNVTPKTAEILQKRMKQSKSLFYVTSKNSPNSKQMPWEFKYFNDLKDKKIAILPIQKNDNFLKNFKGEDYLSLYHYVDIVTLKDSSKKVLSINKSSHEYLNYDYWVNSETNINK